MKREQLFAGQKNNNSFLQFKVEIDGLQGGECFQSLTEVFEALACDFIAST